MLGKHSFPPPLWGIWGNAMTALRNSSRLLVSTVILLFLTSLISHTTNLNVVQQTEVVEFSKDDMKNFFSARNSGDWSSSGSAANPVIINSVDTTPNNEVVIAGLISGSTTLSLGSATINSGQYIEPWIAKADSTGNWQWISKISITGTSQYAEATLQDIAVAPNGDIFATGMFYDTISLGGITLTSTGYWDCWTAKLSSNGQWQWAQALRGNGDYDGVTVTTLDVVYGTSITVDSNNNPITGGFFLGNTDVGVAADTGAQNGDDIEVFVAKYSNSGSLQWSEVARGQGSQEINAMAVDSSNSIWVATTFEVSMTFGSVVANAGINEVPIGIAKISQSGTWQSAYATSGSGQAIVADFDMDNQNNLIMAGSFTGSINLGTPLNSAGLNDAFLGSITSSGSWNWAKSVGGSTNDTASGVVYDSSTGYTIMGLTATSSFSFASQNFSPRGVGDSVVVSFDSNANPVSLFDAGSTDDDAISGIALMPSGDLVVAGNYNGTIDFGTSSAQTQSTNVLMPYVWLSTGVAILDADGDTVPDEDDNCPNVANPSQENTDGDSEGDACDSDDDNDGITDNFPDNCPRNSQTGWTSTRDFNNPSASTDWDNDGCKDDHPEDLDDDNDGIVDSLDTCPRSAYNPPRPTWVSDLATDMDGDGCRDSDEDVNDDGDAFDDAEDDCPTTYGTSTLGQNGCADSDQDGWSDNTDTCPLQAGNSTENGKIACLDSDGDGWANVDDDFIYEPTQWLDSDDDGFGDNANGVMPDACPTESGASIEDRKGCFDSDGDGYSNPDGQWGVNNGADAFINDDTQWSDFDGDGFGDNWGNSSWNDRPANWPGQYLETVSIDNQDACPLQFGDSSEMGLIGCQDYDGDGYFDGIDAFVAEPTQWSDSDNDGFGDNLAGNQGDACPEIYGNSTADRFGCVDSDGDGYSDPDEFWTLSSGADAFIAEPTQWADTDGDGFGDNLAGVTPDACATVRGDSSIDRIGCPDFDGDGYSDPSDFWNTSLGADACPSMIGNSTKDRFGCYDSDGDGYSNKDPEWSYSQGADGYPDDPTKWGKPPEDSTSSSTGMIIGGGAVLLILVLGSLLFLRNKRGAEQYQIQTLEGNQHMGYQGAVQQSGPPVQNFQQIPQQPQPAVVNQDPAAVEYYNALIAQGYPHANAVAYTQQYFPHFVG